MEWQEAREAMTVRDYGTVCNHRRSWGSHGVLCLFRVLAGMLFLLGAPLCHASWTQDIHCPEGSIFRDLRTEMGGEEFCERILPGSLAVKDGPYRSWFSTKFAGVTGSYTNGRRVGTWKECNRFAQCKRQDYPLAGPEEQARKGFKAEVPISYHNGKYTIDFNSCWSTRISQSAGDEPNLSIDGEGLRCAISYTPVHAPENGPSSAFLCEVPYSVGRREVESLDLKTELPRLGLPQFCHAADTGDVLMIVNRKMTVVAGSTDVQCATLEHGGGVETLDFRLNQYASDLVNKEADKDGPLSTRLCFGPRNPNLEQPTVMVHEPGGGTLFRYAFDSDPARARQQEDCVSTSFDLKDSCK